MRCNYVVGSLCEGGVSWGSVSRGGRIGCVDRCVGEAVGELGGLTVSLSDGDLSKFG